MDMLKRMQKANISTGEIPLLGLDIGGITVKVAYFDVEISDEKRNAFEALDESKYLDKEQSENRVLLKKFLKENASAYLAKAGTNTEIKIKNVVGNVRLYLFSREFFSENFLKQLMSLNLKHPFICVTGAAMVNYMNVLVNDVKARVLILSSENEGVVRGIQLLQTQTVSSFHQIQFDADNKPNVVYKIGLLNEMFYPSTVAVIGTSTAYLRLNSQNNYTFLTNSAISGQTFVGLCNVANRLAQPDSAPLSFDDCLKLAAAGKNDHLDVTVKKLCGGSDHKVEQFLYLHNLETGLYVRKDDYVTQFGDLSISCFGDSKKTEENVNINDFAAASLNLVCYQIAEMLCLYSKLESNNKNIIVAGSFLINNLAAKLLITKYVHILNRGHIKTNFKDVFFIDNEASLAALGCLAVDGQNCQVEPQE